MRRAERRAQLLQVATGLFARQGFQGTTTRAIAAAAGVSEIILFRLFPTKQDLYWAVIDEKCRARPQHQQLQRLLAAPGPDHPRFAALAADILERHTRDPSLLRLLLYTGLEDHALADRFYRTYMADYHATLAAFIRRRVRAGRFRAVNPALAARAFLGMISHHILIHLLFGAGRHQPWQVLPIADGLADLWLAGLLKPRLKKNLSLPKDPCP